MSAGGRNQGSLAVMDLVPMSAQSSRYSPMSNACDSSLARDEKVVRLAVLSSSFQRISHVVLIQFSRVADTRPSNTESRPPHSSVYVMPSALPTKVPVDFQQHDP